MNGSGGMVVVKVGGSLFDWPGLGPRLRRWLEQMATRQVLLVPGGGPLADVIRDLDRLHDLGEEISHWLALQAMSVNAGFLAALVPPARVIDHPDDASPAWAEGRVPVLDAHAFARRDEGRPGCLPHGWHVTSDTVALRAAVLLRADRLFLLKSVTIPPGTAWPEAARRGWVDAHFARALEEDSLHAHRFAVEVVNLRGRPG